MTVSYIMYQFIWYLLALFCFLLFIILPIRPTSPFAFLIGIMFMIIYNIITKFYSDRISLSGGFP